AAATVQAAETKIAEAERALSEVAGIDEAVERVAQLLAAHGAAYQAVLTHRQLAEGRQRRAGDVAELERQVETARAEIAKTEEQLTEASGNFDRGKHERVLLSEQN